jgi:hypothetical protein
MRSSSRSGVRRGEHLADPPIAQTLDPVFLVTNTQPAEMASRHAQQFSRFLSGQPLMYCSNASSKRVTKTSHSAVVRRIPAS